eukprot:1992416-Rhodomonas_salina.3
MTTESRNWRRVAVVHRVLCNHLSEAAFARASGAENILNGASKSRSRSTHLNSPTTCDVSLTVSRFPHAPASAPSSQQPSTLARINMMRPFAAE